MYVIAGTCYLKLFSFGLPNACCTLELCVNALNCFVANRPQVHSEQGRLHEISSDVSLSSTDQRDISGQ
jgi:hypothetical protein